MDIPHVEDFAPLLNQALDGWLRAMEVRFVRATADEVIAEWDVAAQHRQAYGLVHGGVHAGVAESIASVGAALYAMPHGLSVVGLENHTSFVRAVRQGRLSATARPLHRGRRTQLWEAAIQDAQGRLVATSRVRLLCLEAGTEVAGEKLSLG
ncbi:MAG: PaaI family thioesterase [Myxococcales bacterium]|nr:PaaI family thioesterase [Myxococcota bacterium]MDW8283434.1 PaaI family thioesterase [Myxococcales bacterium]